MKRKPQEKLSGRLTKLFLTCVKNYNIFYFGTLTRSDDYKPIELAKEMSKYCMDMIAEYEPEDIE